MCPSVYNCPTVCITVIGKKERFIIPSPCFLNPACGIVPSRPIYTNHNISQVNMSLTKPLSMAGLLAVSFLGFTTMATPSLTSETRDTISWSISVCPTHDCTAGATSDGGLQGCTEASGGPLDLSSCVDLRVSTGTGFYYVDWKSFQKIQLGGDFFADNCSISFYTTDNTADYYCTPEFLVGQITGADTGSCHAPDLPGAASGLGINSFSVQCIT